MDILQVVTTKVASLPDSSREGVSAVLVHIQAAERYYARAIAERDDGLFTDVVYRTNHVFEGILKEAYALFAADDLEAKSPYQIEEYLLGHEVLQDRVVNLLKNYRTQWRNPSTHDHKLFISNQEAFLAIVSVTAFASVLLDQMLEKVGFEAGKEKLESRLSELRTQIPESSSHSLLDRLSVILQLFVADLRLDTSLNISATFPKVLGELNAFISAADPALSVQLNPLVPWGGSQITPDMVIWDNSEQAVVEVKLQRASRSGLDPAIHQLLTYIQATNSGGGILLYLHEGDRELATVSQEYQVGDKRVTVVYLTASDRFSAAAKSLPA